LKGKTDAALMHLNKATDLGFSNYEKIINDPDLEALRATEDYIAFKKRGFKL
jgi:hypothetical protein